MRWLFFWFYLRVLVWYMCVGMFVYVQAQTGVGASACGGQRLVTRIILD